MSATRASWDQKPSSTPSQTLPSIGDLPFGSNGHTPQNKQQVNDMRDSGNWSLPSNSQRTSNVSEISQYNSPLTLPPIDQSRPGTLDNSQYGQMHHDGSSMHSIYDDNGSIGGPPGGSLPEPSPSASRRSSFDTRMNGLHLNSPIPGGTPSQSQVSLASSHRDSLASQMQRERGISGDSPGPHDGGNHNPFYQQPRLPQSVSRSNPAPARTAPPISGARQGIPYGHAPHPNAPSPTKGYPYAFPDPAVTDMTNGARTSQTSLGSASSSMYPTPTRQPSYGSGMGMNGMNGGVQYHQPESHHHGFDTRRSSVASDNYNATPYSRTPELRVSHKLAERKRRKEMKELFDELREALPAERGGKSSKWEVLTKAIEFVRTQSAVLTERERDLETMRRELEITRNDRDAIRAEVHKHRANAASHYTHDMQGLEHS